MVEDALGDLDEALRGLCLRLRVDLIRRVADPPRVRRDPFSWESPIDLDDPVERPGGRRHGPI